MSPTSYQTAPPRVAELHTSNSGRIRSTRAAPARAAESKPHGPRLRHPPVARDLARAPRGHPRGRVWPGGCRLRGGAVASVPEAEGLLWPARDRVDAELLAAARAAGDLQLRRRRRQHRRGRGPGARHPRRLHARRPHRDDGRPRVRADPGGRPPAASRPRPPYGRPSGSRGSRMAGSGATSTARRSAVVGAGRIGQAVAPSARRARDGGRPRRSRRRPPAGARARGLRLAPRAPDAPRPATWSTPTPSRAMKPTAILVNTARGRDRRPGRPGRRAARGCDRRRRPRRHRPRAAAARSPAPRRARTFVLPHLGSAMHATRERWPTSPSTTSSPAWPASRCPTTSRPRDAGRGRQRRHELDAPARGRRRRRRPADRGSSAGRGVTRLGDRLGETGVLSEDAMGRVLSTLAEYRAIVEEQGAERARAVLTSAVRDAANGDAFLALRARAARRPRRRGSSTATRRRG